MSLDPVLEAARQGKPIDREAAEAILSLEGAPPELLDSSGRVRDLNLGRELRFYYPLPRFPNVSVTGSRCALRCKHCNGFYLRGMTGVETPSKLKEFCRKLEEGDALGLLVSGGSDARGRVPLDGFYDALAWVKEKTSLIVNVHSGLLDSRQAEEIASTGVDIVSVDVVGSDETVKRVYGLDAAVEDYRETLFALKEAGVHHVVPHICFGLDFGEIKGEAAALEITQGFDPELIVLLGLIPTPGTAMENVRPLSAKDMARAVAATRLICPDASVAVGCMRPRGEKGPTEVLAIRAGADRLVLPARSTVEEAEKEGYEVRHLDGCCSVPRGFEHITLRR